MELVSISHRDRHDFHDESSYLSGYPHDHHRHFELRLHLVPSYYLGVLELELLQLM